MEFKRLSDVEVVAEPAESANVLIEENGVIKKAPKTAVGGAGEPDLVVTITVSEELNEGTINDYGVANVTEVVGSVQTVLDKISNGQDPSVIIKNSYTYGGAQWSGYVKNPVIIKKGDSILHLMWIQCSGYIHWYRHELEIDNTNTPTYYYGN